uniref:CCHC-type domain-containing protein n=1 Tax=Tanacetum cinerariifolium TaxID=118510 RepID=A0A6L2NV13_TANCI|nr:hypothetical protein [Tanacetum cinerariifolium]
MWENAKTVAPTPSFTIIQLDVGDNFVVNITHLNMIRENKFDGYLRVDPHDHIREFLAICMFKYSEIKSEAVKPLIFLFSLCDEAKTWFNELNEESITSWEQMRKTFINNFFPPSLFNRLLLEIRNFSQLVCESLFDAWLRLKSMLQKCHGHGLTKGASIQIFYYGLDEPTQGILDVTARGIFHYKSPNQAFQLLEDKVLFKHDWSTKSKTEYHRESISFADGKLQDIRNKYNELREGNAFKNHQNDDTPIDDCKTTGVLPKKKSKLINQEPQSKTDFEKLMTKFLDGQRVTNMFFKTNVNDMIIKMKQNKNNFQTIFKNMERKIDDWSKSKNVSSKQTNWSEPPPPLQAHTEHVNAVFIESEKSDDSPKIQKDPPLLIIVTITLQAKESDPSFEIQQVKAPPEETAKDKGLAGEVFAKKKGRTVVKTTEDMQKRKNDVKAKTTLLLALPDEPHIGKSKVPTIQGVSTASAQVSTDNTDVAAASLSYDTVCAFIATQPNRSQIKYKLITQIDDDDIEEMDIKWNLALLSMRADRFWKKTGKKITIQRSDVASFDKSKVECFNCHKMGHFARECRSPRSQDRGKRESYKKDPKVEEPTPKAMIAIDGIGWE